MCFKLKKMHRAPYDAEVAFALPKNKTSKFVVAAVSRHNAPSQHRLLPMMGLLASAQTLILKVPWV